MFAFRIMDVRSKNDDNSKKNKAALMAAFLLALAIIYLLAGIFFGFYIPCPFRTLTGLKCPGCGMSHAATDVAMAVMALIRSDTDGAHVWITEAFRANALFIPIFAYIIYAAIRFLTDKEDSHNMLFNVIDAVFLVVIVIWWIVRNII